MHRAMSAVVTIALALVVEGAALRADDPAQPGCQERCAAMGAELEQRCFSADGVADPECLAAVQARVQACIEGCGVEPPPPPPPCAERCAAMGADMEKRCVRDDGTADRECLARVRAQVEACVAACENPPPPPDPTCPDLCKQRIVAEAEACIAAGGDPRQCWGDVEARVEECLLADCGIEPPPPPPTCAERCAAMGADMEKRCVRDDGTADRECLARVRAQVEACVAACENPPPPPEPVPCEVRCEELRAQLVAKCADAAGNVLDPACLAEVEATVERCRANCVDPQPPPGTDCETECAAAAERSAAECLASSRTPEECEARKLRMLSACLELCSAPPPEEPPTCEERCRERVQQIKASCADPASPVLPEECELRVQEALRACLAEECANEPPPVEGCEDRCTLHAREVFDACARSGDATLDCESRAAEAYRRCAVACSGEPPPVDPPGCDSLCISQAEAKYRTCVAAGGDESACRAEADALLGLCLERCAAGAPCESRCAVAAEVVADGCALGGLSPEQCLRLANVVLSACVTGCRPEVPCSERCDRLAASAARECLARGGTEGECAAAADEVRNGCLPNCETGEAPPCDVQCEERADAIAAECLAAGKTADECAALRESFAARCEVEHGANCVEELKADATQFRPFLRGDSNRDGRRNISDPISLLGWLFLADEEPLCKDAADANDDGQVNISDPVTMLGFLFLGAGPLPAPADREGQDATDDALACAE